MSYKKDISDYYEQTRDHYKYWWKLDQGMALHYGIWEKDTKNFVEALANTNIKMAELAKVKKGDIVLDAGCGVGGSAIFLAKEHGAKSYGITLNERQKSEATANALKHNVEQRTNFSVQDYLNTNFEDETFDVVWGCESVNSSPDKEAFLKEASRILKPGGRVIVTDYFMPNSINRLDHKVLLDWETAWALGPICTEQEFIDYGENHQLKLESNTDFTNQIMPTVKWMYRTYWYGLIPSEIYNLFHPKVSRYARHHYRSGYYQYKSLKKGLWRYRTLVMQKA
ncbi:MAG: methyltransferase domain-containing protein [Schleiferiaceae bacterium]|jgi:cyclopropane fatty-acyl-phospholipid synthase-like methyltransferase|nr:methyltransferase domain-containing protein [Schleiferiaceae bacterium]